MKRKERYFGLALIISTLLFHILTLPGCAPTKVKTYPRETLTEITSPGRPIAGKTYAEAISQWKSHQDLVKWMERDFSLDMERYKRFKGTLPFPRTPEETFQLKSGIYIDTAEFLKKTLNQINPSYRAQTVVILVRPNVFNHYVCAFRKEGKLFVLDYGTPYKEITGVHGPYNSLDEYKRFYEKHYPEKRRVEGIVFLQ
jgi:hypothetical protein